MATAVIYTQRKKQRRAQTTTGVSRTRIAFSALTSRHCNHQIETCYKCQAISLMMSSCIDAPANRSPPSSAIRSPTIANVTRKAATTDGCRNREDAEDGLAYKLKDYAQSATNIRSIQSHRSRVFARREEKFPALENGNRTTRGNKQIPNQNGRFSEPLKQIQNVSHKVARATNISAPHPAGKTTSQLPFLSQATQEHKPPTTQRSSRLPYRNTDYSSSSPQVQHKAEVSPSRISGTHIAGISSKEQGTHALRSDKMATGWAEVRAGQTIPKLRDSQDDERSPRDRSNHSPGRASKDTDIKSEASNHRASKETLSKKPSPDLESTNSTNNNRSPYKKTSSVSRKQVTYKSKLSSGYNSMSSGSQQDDPVINKQSVFKNGTEQAPAQEERVKELANVYSSKVPVEEAKPSVVGVLTAPEEHILTEKETEMYNHLKQTYNKSAKQDRQVRKEKFFRKLQDVQLDTALEHNRQVAVRLARKEQAKRRQLEELNHIRQKFEDERTKRFKSQYVSKNFQTYDRQDRTEYGLPEHFMTQTQYQEKLKGKGGGVKVTALAFIRREVKLKKNYSKMFVEPVSGQDLKEPMREGRDRITLDTVDESGNPKKGKKVNVKSELKEAEKMLKDLNNAENGDILLESPRNEPASKYTRSVIRPVLATKQTKGQTAQQQKSTNKPGNNTEVKAQPNKAAVPGCSPVDERGAKDQRYADALSKWNKPEIKIYETNNVVEEKTIPGNQAAQKQKKVQAASTPTQSAISISATANKHSAKTQSSAKSEESRTKPLTNSQPTNTKSPVSASSKSSDRNSAAASKLSATSRGTGKSSTKPIVKPTSQVVKESAAKSASKIASNPAPSEPKASLKSPSVFNQPSSTGATLNKPADTVSIHSRISVITEESETDVDFYEKLMAKYGIELSDDEDD